MTYCHSRIAMLLALPALTVWAFFISAAVDIPIPNVDDLQVATLVATVVFLGAWWAIWRTLIERDLRRLGATIAMAVFIIGQVLIWLPMWTSTDCAHNDTLRCAQSVTDLGLWCLGFALTWWGGRRWREIQRQSRTIHLTNVKGRQIMTPSTVRLAVGFALMPLLPGIFYIVTVALDHFLSMDSDYAACIGYLTCAIVAIVTWLGSWRRTISWTPRRKLLTGGLVALMLASIIAPLVPDSNTTLIDMSVDLVPVFVLAAWFAGTALVWRQRPGDMPVTNRGVAATSITKVAIVSSDEPISVPCGNCDYDLRGLREARCPECGWTTTLDALVRRGVAACLATGD